MRRHQDVAQQQGVVLAEWLLAAMLGLVILAASVAWLQSSLQLAQLQRVPRQMADSATWLLQRLQRETLLAGAGQLHPLGLDDPALAGWWPRNDSGPGWPASDQLLLQRQLAVDTLDCEGVQVASGQRLVERYFLRTDSAASGWVLACDGGYCSGNECRRLGDAGVALQSEMESFQILYGVAVATGDALDFVDAGRLAALPAAPTVKALRLGLLLRSPDLQIRTPRWSAPADWPGPSLAPAPDRYARSVWQLTMELPHG